MSEKRVPPPSAVLILGAISIAAWLWRRENRDGNHSRNPRSRGRPAKRIAHELNDYLGAIRSHCEVAKITHPYDVALVRRLDAAMESATQAAALLRQLEAKPR